MQSKGPSGLILSGLILAVALTAPAATARAPVEESPADAFRALEQEFASSELPRAAKYREFKPRFEAFADAHAGTDIGLDARLWVLQYSSWLRQDGTMHEASRAAGAALLDEYGDSPRLGMMAELSFVFSKSDREFFAGKLRESPHEAVRAVATYQLAKRSKGDAQAALFRELAEEFGGLKRGFSTYGEIADAALHPHSPDALDIGEVAPDIVGTDVDGVEFKLSDYRGKVVVLDFWGDW